MSVVEDRAHPREVIVDWLGRLYDNMPEGQWLTVNYGGSFFATDWQRVDDYDATADAILAHNERHCVWLGVATRKERLQQGRGGADDCADLPGLFLDIDIADPQFHAADNLPPTVEDARRLVESFPLWPTAMVHSGHGLQVWWLFSEPLRAAEAGLLLDRWEATWLRYAGAQGYGLDNVFDVARVLRVPGTINRKNGDAAPVALLSADWTARYGVDEIDPYLDEAPVKPTPGPTLDPGFTGARPGDVWAASISWAELLEADGATFLGEAKSRTGTYQKWARPGVTDHNAGTVGIHGSDVLKVFSNAWRVVDPTTGTVTTLEQNATYTKFGYYAATRHGGDHAAAGRALRAEGFTRAPYTEMGAPLSIDDGEFWGARPELELIRTWAQAQLSGPWAVLGVVLARVICQVPPAVVLPPIIEDVASLNLAVALVGRSGDGKGGATGVARRAVDVGAVTFNTHTLGSGQGIAHGYATWVPGKKGEPGYVEQYATSALFTVEEVDHLAGHAGQTGSTMLAELRRFLMGEKLGHLYVDRSKRVEVAEHRYRGAFVVGVQPARAETLIGDADGGTPQRFVWLPVLDIDPPDAEPERPDTWRWRPPKELPAPDPQNGGLRLIPVCADAADAIRAERRRRARGEGDPLDGHRLLCRERVAAALAVLAGRYGIADEDWQLSDVVMAVSDATRSRIAVDLEQQRRRANIARAEARDAQDAHIAEGATTRESRVFDRILTTLKEAPDGIVRSTLRGSFAGRDRTAFDTAIKWLLADGQVVEDTPEAGACRGTRYKAVHS